MTNAPSLSDDEALWFPVQMGSGDSFSRPTSADGAPLDADGSASSEDDGIGLPRGRGPRGPRPTKKGFKASGWLWLTLCGATVMGVAGYAARREIAAEAIQGWLKGQGVEQAHLKLEALGFNHAAGTLYIGDAKTPEFSIGHFEVDYSLQPFAGGGMPLARVHSLHLVRSLVQFSFKGGKLNFGELDHLVQSALTAPPSSAPPPDSIVIDDATVQITTDYGLVRGHGNLSLQDGALNLARVELPAIHLSGPLGEGDLARGLVTAHSVTGAGGANQLQVQARFDADQWTLRGDGDPVDAQVVPSQATVFKGVSIDLDSTLPYRHAASPDVAFSGPTEHDLSVQVQSYTAAGASAAGLRTSLHLDGGLKVSGQSVGFTGTAKLLSSAESLTSGAMSGRGIRLNGGNLNVAGGFSPTGSVTGTIEGPVSGDVAGLRQGDLSATNAHLALNHLRASLGAAGFDADFTGGMDVGQMAMTDASLAGVHLSLKGQARSDAATGTWRADLDSDLASDHGSYTGLKATADAQRQAQAQAIADAANKPPVPGTPNPPPPDAAVMLDRGLERFSLRARGIHLRLDGTSQAGAPVDFSLAVTGGAQADLAGGGKVVLNASPIGPVLASHQTTALGLAVSGPDLPGIIIGVDHLGFTPQGLLAGDYKLAADFNFYPVAGGRFTGQGHFTSTVDGGYAIALAQPAHFAATSAELGDHLTALSATLVQTGASFLTLDSTGAFRVAGAFRNLSLLAPNETVALQNGTGVLQAFTLPNAVGLKAMLASADVSDTLPSDQTRFNPLGLSGNLTNDAHALTGRFTAVTPSVRDAKGQPLAVAAIDLDNDNLTGKGSLGFHTLDMTFNPQGLQPVYLSPLVAAIFSKDVTGKVGFNGAFNWDKRTASSGGVLTLDGLNYVGATGATTGLNGQIAFTSLAPLKSDPGQMISIGSMQVGVPLSDLKLSLQFLGDTVALESAVVQTPGGPVTLEPTTLPLDGKSAIAGAVSFNGLDFGKIIAATDLASSMTFEGNLSGRLPFRIDGGHLSFTDGAMASDAPGRLSIRRSAVTGVAATGSLTSADAPSGAKAGMDPNFNPFQDLAFQAMEAVHYDKIDARLNSIPGGKLDINFHIKGYFDPPQKQQARIGLFDYLSGKWMQKPIKLPSGTPVELYLDVPVNLDDILNDLTAFNVRTAQKSQ